MVEQAAQHMYHRLRPVVGERGNLPCYVIIWELDETDGSQVRDMITRYGERSLLYIVNNDTSVVQ